MKTPNLDPVVSFFGGWDFLLPVTEKLGDQVKGDLQKKTKIIDRASLSSAPESTSSKLQYEPFLFTVA